ncbi:MAG: STAS domain-containing protein [Planctomycetota bacterium]
MDNAFEIEQDGGVVTARLEVPDVSYAQMQELVQGCVERMRYDNANDFIVDLTKVEFLASACLGALVELLQDVEHQRGQVALAGCNENVAFLFKVTKLDSVFALCDDIEEAIASL